MTPFKLSIAAMALLGFSSVASARLPGGGGPLPSVTSQVRAEAKQDGIWQRLSKPQIKLDYSKSGKTATATITALSRFTGGVRRTIEPKRVSMYSAKFRIGKAMEGKIATPMKTSGQVWHMFMRAQ